MATTEIDLAAKTVAIPHSVRTMKALVYHGPGKRAWESKPRPAISIRATPSCELPPRPSAEPTCTF